jgi:hypothetical protein
MAGRITLLTSQCQHSSIPVVKLVCLDSTAVVPTGPGSPAFFSRYLIEHLRTTGHEVTISRGFDEQLCAGADAVWTEWANEDAFEAAASGVCKRLVVRLRGFEAFGPLDQLEWSNVDALVYESPFLKQLVEDKLPGLRGFRSHVIPSGIDVDNIPFKTRGPGPIVALVARGVADKGYQLAFEWARQRPDIQLHVALALPEPRLKRYLEYTKPNNVTIYPQVDTVKWLDEIGANYLLSASNWESLGYTIAEAMATGIKPLIHDTPGVHLNWASNSYTGNADGSVVLTWRGIDELNNYTRTLALKPQLYQSDVYRHFVEEHLDAARQSRKFADLMLGLPARAPAPSASATGLILQIEAAVQSNQLASADAWLLDFRNRASRLGTFDDHRSGLALRLAAAYHDANDLSNARVWALRSLGDVMRADTLCLLGEIAAAEGDLENAERWYDASLRVESPATRYPTNGLADSRGKRCAEIARELHPVLTRADAPSRYLIVVALRNAEKYIGACLESIKQQRRPFMCVVIDDASTDKTWEAITGAGSSLVDMHAALARLHSPGHDFSYTRRAERKCSLFNIVEAVQEFGRPNDVVVIVDGDDKLLPGALNALDYAYSGGAWMTYGNFVTATGRSSWMPPYSHRVVQAGSYRTQPWAVSHPKTFKKELFDKIDPADFKHHDQWFHTAGDVALMMPMLEMAAERAVYLPEMLYEWNDDNPESDHRVDPKGQVQVRNLILAKKPYTRLDKL